MRRLVLSGDSDVTPARYRASATLRVRRRTRPGTPSSWICWHEVAFAPASRLGAIMETPVALVNSRHHQAVTPEMLTPGLIAATRSSDGIVEAIEFPAYRWAFGVQWHPEREELQEPAFSPLNRRLFAAFTGALQGVAEG